MSNGRLKASTNRVRTSIALQANSMWTTTIGQALDAQAGSNSAIEASLNAPQTGGGRRARQQAAANVVAQTDGFNTAVHTYESLLTLARTQGAIGAQNRGACKVCGQLGHLTKQCRNMQSVFFKAPDATGTAGKGLPPAALEAARADLMVRPDVESDLRSDLSDSDDSSSSSSDSEDERRRRKEKKRKRKERKKAEEKRKRKKEKKRKAKKAKEEKAKKKRRKSNSGSSSSDSD